MEPDEQEQSFLTELAQRLRETAPGLAYWAAFAGMVLAGLTLAFGSGRDLYHDYSGFALCVQLVQGWVILSILNTLYIFVALCVLCIVLIAIGLTQEHRRR